MNELKTVADVVKDPNFIGFVDKNLSDLIKKRRNRPAARDGFKYKRDWYDRMRSDGTLNTAFFLSNIEDVVLKQSSLPSEIRNVIKHIGDKSLYQTEQLYAKK